MGFNAEFYGPGRPWLEVLPGTCWDCASPSLMAEGNPQPGFHSPLISPFYPQYITITPPFLLLKFHGNLANGDMSPMVIRRDHFSGMGLHS